MSYVRLLRLPPHSHCSGVTRCLQRQVAARGNCTRANNLSNSNASPVCVTAELRHVAGQYAKYHNSAEVEKGCNHNGGAVTAWDSGVIDPGGAGRHQFAKVSTNVSVLSRHGSKTIATVPFKRRGSAQQARALSSHAGVPNIGLRFSVRVSWGSQETQWQLQSLRAFSTASPDPKESGKDSVEHQNGQRSLPGQRAFVGGLLKPSDKEIEPVKDESAQRFKDLQEEHTLFMAARKDPKQTSEQVEQSQTALSQTKAVAMVKKIPGMTWSATKSIALFLWEIMKNPSSLKDKLVEAQHHLKELGRHYWLGCKLLWSDIKTARKIVNRMLRGFPMTRRERKQLLRTASDIFRMVPLAAFVLIPFMDFLLPVALRIFPSMLPSTFQDSLKEEEKLKKELRLRMAYAGFLQETVTEMAVKKKTRAEDGDESEATTTELTDFIEKAKMGEITNQDIPKFAKMFKDELTMDNISRSGLVNMCRYMGLPPFGNDNFLRFQLRNKLRTITQDDQRILWEGVASLTKQELQEACRERGMRATGLTKQGYVRQLSQWLDLSTKKSVPISLLIMSRAFTLQAPDPARALAQSISAMDDDVVTEVMIEAASSEEKKTAEYRTRKLESLERQNELIEEENRKREEAKKAKETKAREVKKAEEAKAADMDGSEDVNEMTAHSEPTSEIAEDAAVDKVIEQAAIAAAARTQHTQTAPDITMREGEKHFAAASDSGTGDGKDEVITEADIVAPKAGVETGDRAVEAKIGHATKSPSTKATEDSKEQLQEIAKETVDGKGKDGDSEEDGGLELTVAELHALESLASPSSVEKERAQLAMMKAALQESLGEAEEVAKPAESSADEPEQSGGEAGDATEADSAAISASSGREKDEITSDEAGERKLIKEKEGKSATDASEENQSSIGAVVAPSSESSDVAAVEEGSPELQEVEDGKDDKPAVDKSVQRVQNKLASMLNRLEVEIQNVEERIGDKLHILDRDKDGMVSAEEIAFVIQHVLTAASTPQEARAIAEEMDTDSDGQISVAELIAWVKKHSEQDAEDVFNQLYQRRETRGQPPDNEE